MKILLTSVGTRGDMEPFLAIGEILQKNGHRVMCVFPQQFKKLVDETGLEFASLGSDFINMLNSETGVQALGGGGSGLSKFWAFVQLALKQKEINKELVKNQQSAIDSFQPDRIVHNGKAMYPIIWARNNPGQNIFVSPIPYMHYVKGHTHVALNNNYGEFLNKLTFKLGTFGLTKTILSSAKMLGIIDIKKDEVQHILKTNKIIYAISQCLFKRPNEWENNMHVLGYLERNKPHEWIPPDELVDFLKKNPKCLFLSFGSMTNPEPVQKTKIFLNILKRNHIPTIINIAAGGLIKPDQFDEKLFYFIAEIPYYWILPRVYAAVHHGGSGTTHLALKYNCASMIIPHIIDQFVFNKILTEKNVGPKGIKIGKINEKNLEPKILDLYHNPVYKENAQLIGQSMRNEDYGDKLSELITANI